MSRCFIALLVCFSAFVSRGQAPAPIADRETLQRMIYDINFTADQQQILWGRVVRLTLEKDPDGIAVLSQVEGVNDSGIIDSLFHVSRKFPRFPVSRKSEHYYLEVPFLPYSQPERSPLPRDARPDDFAELELSGRYADLLLGLVANSYNGIASNYVYPGGAIRLDVLWGGRRFATGLALGMYINKARRDYPILTIYEQNRARSTAIVALALAKNIYERDSRKLNIQLDLGYGIHNVISTEKTGTEESLDFTGFCPGFAVDYMIRVGSDRVVDTYPYPAVRKNWLNLHFALRPLFFNRPQASGLMVEAGVAIRMQMHQIESYEY